MSLVRAQLGELFYFQFHPSFFSFASAVVLGPGVQKILEILRESSKFAVRDFYEIQCLQTSSRVTSFFSGLRAKIKSSLIRNIGKYRSAADIGSEIEFCVFPINGCANFTRGIPHFALCVLIKKSGTPFACAVEAPMLNTAFCTEKNCGTFVLDSNSSCRTRIRDCHDFNDALLLVGNGCYGCHVFDLSKISQVRSLGCTSLDAAYVACGRADALLLQKDLVNQDMLLLAKLIVEESGGMTTEWDNYVLLSGKSLTREIKNLVEIKH